MESPATANLRRLRILLVDDDLNYLEGTLKWLTPHHDVVCFLRAGDALGMLREGDAAVDLIMVDVRVPGEKKDASFLILDIRREFGNRFPIVALSDVVGASAALKNDLQGAVWTTIIKPLNETNLDALTAFASVHVPFGLSGGASSSGQKGKRISWNEELHQKFLRAVEAEGGLDAAKPDALLQRMLEEGGLEWLTRDQVKSHLQNERNKAKVMES